MVYDGALLRCKNLGIAEQGSAGLQTRVISDLIARPAWAEEGGIVGDASQNSDREGWL